MTYLMCDTIKITFKPTPYKIFLIMKTTRKAGCDVIQYYMGEDEWTGCKTEACIFKTEENAQDTVNSFIRKKNITVKHAYLKE